MIETRGFERSSSGTRRLASGTAYVVLTTELAPKPDKKTGRMPTEQELARWQRVLPIMNEILQGKGLARVLDDRVFVTAMKGPLEDGWRQKVEAFAARVPVLTTAA
jgi:hypothetical protein